MDGKGREGKGREGVDGYIWTVGVGGGGVGGVTMGFSMEVFGAGEGVCVRSDGDDAFYGHSPIKIELRRRRITTFSSGCGGA